MRLSNAPVTRVFICSRYTGDVARNTRVAAALCLMAIARGYAPFAPHLLYPQFLNDSDPEKRALGIALGLIFMEACDEVWVYTGNGVSDGMEIELKHAGHLGTPVIEVEELDHCQAL
jgi:hypothetical protein